MMEDHIRAQTYHGHDVEGHEVEAAPVGGLRGDAFLEAEEAVSGRLGGLSTQASCGPGTARLFTDPHAPLPAPVKEDTGPRV